MTILIKRLSLLTLALAVIITAIVPVSAAGGVSPWTELLSYATVNDSGNNMINFGAGSSIASVTIATPQYMRATKIDLLVATPSGRTPSTVQLSYSGSYTTLTVAKIDAYTCRIYGNIPNGYYRNVILRFNRGTTSGSDAYQLLSCRLTAVENQMVQANADVYINGSTYSTGMSISVDSAYQDVDHIVEDYQVRVNVYDWQKYDRLTIWGSIDNASVGSLRATVDKMALPITVNWFAADAAGAWIDSLSTSSDGKVTITDSAVVGTWGKTLYSVEIDLSGVDRTLTTSPLYLYLTGSFHGGKDASFVYNCQYVSGSVLVADTAPVTWWDKFRSFMTGLFNPPSSGADDFVTDAEQGRNDFDDLNQQLEELDKPAASDIPVDVGDYVAGSDRAAVGAAIGQLAGNSLVTSMMCITLIVALLGFLLFGKRG